jgi:hypothetical protein
MHKFTLINWSQYSKASEQFPPCNSLQEAMANAKHYFPYNWDANYHEEYTQVIETNDHDEIVNDYYFVTL